MIEIPIVIINKTATKFKIRKLNMDFDGNSCRCEYSIIADDGEVLETKAHESEATVLANFGLNVENIETFLAIAEGYKNV